MCFLWLLYDWQNHCAARSVDKEMTECSGIMEYRNVFERYEKASTSPIVYTCIFQSWSASGLFPSRVDPPWYCLFDQCLLAIITYCFLLFSFCMFISVVKPTYVYDLICLLLRAHASRPDLILIHSTVYWSTGRLLAPALRGTRLECKLFTETCLISV